jgi:hypothetical protein
VVQDNAAGNAVQLANGVAVRKLIESGTATILRDRLGLQAKSHSRTPPSSDDCNAKHQAAAPVFHTTNMDRADASFLCAASLIGKGQAKGKRTYCGLA